MVGTTHRFGIPPKLGRDHTLEQVTTTTPNDQGLLLELILQGTTDAAVARKLGSTPELCKLGLDILSWQKLKTRLPSQLPLGTKVAHKTGTGSRGFMDAGIVFKGERPLFILTAYTEHVPEALPDGTPGLRRRLPAHGPDGAAGLRPTRRLSPGEETSVRLGVLVPAGNPTIEPELYRMAPRSLTIHFARLDTLAGEPGGVDGMERRTLGYLDSLPAATRSLAAVKPDAVVLAHTAVSYLTTFADEPALLDRLRALAGPRAFTAAGAIHAALRHLGARRLALATPYPETISAAGRTYWQAAGFEIVAHRVSTRPNIYDETEDRAYALGRAADAPDRRRRPDQRHRPPHRRHHRPPGERPQQTRRDQPSRHPLARPDSCWRSTTAVKGYGRLLSEGTSPIRGSPHLRRAAGGRASGWSWGPETRSRRRSTARRPAGWSPAKAGSRRPPASWSPRPQDRPATPPARAAPECATASG